MPWPADELVSKDNKKGRLLRQAEGGLKRAAAPCRVEPRPNTNQRFSRNSNNPRLSRESRAGPTSQNDIVYIC